MSPTDTTTEPPSLAFEPAVLTFDAAIDSLTVSIKNTGGDSLVWTITAADNARWLSIDPSSGDGDTVVTVGIERSLIPQGVSDATLAVSSNGGDGTITIHVALLSTGDIVLEGDVPPAEEQ